MGKSSLVICAEDLIHQTGIILRRLEAFLQLKTPLDEHYSMFSLTGARRYGDPSSYIREGKIERQRANHAEITVSDAVLEEATTSYQQCLTGFREPLAAAGQKNGEPAMSSNHGTGRLLGGLLVPFLNDVMNSPLADRIAPLLGF